MKYVVLAFALLAVGPLGLLLRGQSRVHAQLSLLLGLLLWLPLVNVNLVSHETYRGADRGFEFTHVDLVAWTLLVALPKPARSTPFRLVQVAYFLACASTLWSSAVPLYTAFSLWKLMRMFLFTAAVWRICTSPARVVKLLDGLALGLVFQAAYCIKLRYWDGYHQVAGVFSHQNSLGMAVNLVLPVLLARFMYVRSYLAGAGVAAGCLCVIFSLSRGSLTMLLIGLSSVYFVSMLRGLTPRKAAISVCGFAGASVVVAKSFDTIVRRFEKAPQASANARETFEQVARMMFDDHPFGIGMNMYSWEMSKVYGPRLGLPDADAGVAHHIYWLTVAECGCLGIVTYVVLLVVVLWAALRAAIAARGDLRGQLAVGCVAGLAVMYLQGTLEWIARQTVQSYLFWMVGVLGYALLQDVRRYPQRARELAYGAFPAPTRASG